MQNVALAEPDGLFAQALADDLFESDKCSAADEEDVAGVYLDVLLLGMLSSALWGHVGGGAFEHFQQGLLYAFAGDVSGDGDVLACLADFVYFVDVKDAALGGFDIEIGGVEELEQQILDVFADVAGFGQCGGVADGEWHVEYAGEGLCQKRFAASGGPDQEDVGFIEFDLGVTGPVYEPFIMRGDGDSQDFFGEVLADYILVELFDNLAWGVDFAEELLAGAASSSFLFEDRLAQLDAFSANVDVARPFDQRPDIAVALAAK